MKQTCCSGSACAKGKVGRETFDSVHEINFKRDNAAAAYLRHALHVQLNEVSLVVLQDGQAHTKDNLKALQTRSYIFIICVKNASHYQTHT